MMQRRYGKAIQSTMFALALMTAAVTTALGQTEPKPAKLTGKIVFLREKNIWVMNADGSGKKAWRSFGNAVGRLSWHPNGKRLAFSRQGDVTYNLPDGGGGSRRIYDIFASDIDSTREMYWFWVTLDHGSRSPEWSRDGKYILYARDVNANQVDAEAPDYQIEYRTFDGKEIHRLARKDANPSECMGLDPTWSPDGKQIAFIYQKRKPRATEKVPTSTPLEAVGLVIVPAEGIMASEPELEAQARRVPNASSPVWSPDGRWIAYIGTRSDSAGIFLVSPDGASRKPAFLNTPTLVATQAPVSWSSDSEWIVFASTDGYVFVVNSDGGQKPQRITSDGNAYYPALSPK